MPPYQVAGGASMLAAGSLCCRGVGLKAPGAEVEWWRCLKKTVLREGVERGSDRLGELETGAVFEAVESGFDEGVRRVRTKDGWASVLSAKGTPLLQRCPAPGTEAPLPRCATPDGIGCF